MLVHQDTELVDPDFCAKVRAGARATPMSPSPGCIGALGVRSIAWWEGSVTWASFIHRYDELGGGDLPGFAWSAGERPPFARTGEVDVVDGFLLVLSPWAVRNLRFDESLGALHGYDVDFCLQARAAGRKVVTADFRAVHHHSLELVSDPDGLGRGAHARRGEVGRADPRRATVLDQDWRAIARRAGPRPRPARAAAVSKQLQYDAREREFQRAFDEIEHEHQLAASRCRCGAPTAGAAAPPRGGAAALVARARGGSRPSTRSTARARCRRGAAAARAARRSRTRSSRASAAARASCARARAAGHATPRASWTCASARWKTRLASRRASSGLRSHGSRTSASAPAHGASVPRRRRGRRTPARPRAAGRSRSATKSSTAVSTPLRGPPSRAAAPRYGRPPARIPGSSGMQPAALVDRLAVLRRDQLGRVVVVAAGVRPADVVEHQQRQLARPRVGDQPQLLA